MSTTNPDVTAETRRTRLVPFGAVAAVVGILIAPVVAVANWATGSHVDNLIVVMLSYVIISVAAGLFCYQVLRPTPWVIAAYSVAYVGGLMLVLSSAEPLAAPDSIIHNTSWLAIAIPYLGAVACLVMWARRHTAVLQTRGNGVDTTATIVGAGVDGQVNYIQHQRLTLKFTDTQGTERYFRTGITGGFYNIGDTVPIRYDRDHPDRVRAIIVGGQPYVPPERQP